MDDKATEALESLRQKFTSGNDVAVERAMITRAEYEALVSAQQADHIGDANEMVAAPVVPEEWRQALLALADRIEAADEQPIAVSRTGADILRALLAAPAPEQLERVELTDAEIDEIWARHAMSDTFDCVHLLRDAIAAHEAKQPTGSGPVAGTVYDPASGGVA